MSLANYATASVLILSIVIPIILQHVLTYFDNIYNNIHISLYGLYLCAYLVLQIIFASVNNIRIPKITKDLQQNLSSPPDTSDILVVGYKENADYYRSCLESVKSCVTCTSQQLNKVIVVIDGNTDDDKYMVDIFLDVLQGIHIDLNSSLNNKEALGGIIQFVHENKFVCITQPHHGKRHALHTGFMLSILENEQFNTLTKTIFCTDSDTILDPHVINNMLPLFLESKLGAVAGDLGIYTKYDSGISFLSSIRYWFAFNMERAYQSFNKYVLCVSGPIGMYRLTCLNEIIDPWVQQTFLGKICTYGDDRHLTNQILLSGYNVIFTPIAQATTETPSDITRFFRQQTRWSKSSYREFFWSLKAVSTQHILLSVDLLYLLLFPYLVMGYLLYVLWAGDYLQLQTFVIIVAISGFIKSIYGTICNKNPETLFYSLYIIPYVCVVFPAKLWALLTITDTTWGSAFRKNTSPHIYLTTPSYLHPDLIFLSLWNFMLASGVGYHIYQLVSQRIYMLDFIYLLVLSVFFVLYFASMILYVRLKHRPQSHSTYDTTT